MWFYWNATGCIKRIIDMIVNKSTHIFFEVKRAFKKCAKKVNALQKPHHYNCSFTQWSRKYLKRCKVDI